MDLDANLTFTWDSYRYPVRENTRTHTQPCRNEMVRALPIQYSTYPMRVYVSKARPYKWSRPEKCVPVDGRNSPPTPYDFGRPLRKCVLGVLRVTLLKSEGPNLGPSLLSRTRPNGKSKREGLHHLRHATRSFVILISCYFKKEQIGGEQYLRSESWIHCCETDLYHNTAWVTRFRAFFPNTTLREWYAWQVAAGTLK